MAAQMHSYSVYLFGIVLVTLLNSWQLLGARGRLCVSDLCSSAALPPPTPCCPHHSSLMGNFSPNNLSPSSLGTKPAFHQHHCLSLLPPLVLLLPSNSPYHTQTHFHVPSVGRPAMCPFITVPLATPLYVEST